MVRESCQLNLERVRHAAARGLQFYASDRLYCAFQEFFQALFIARRVYPIAYNKWIQEQVSGWLGLPELYEELSPVLALRQLKDHELNQRAKQLRELLERWTLRLANRG